MSSKASNRLIGLLFFIFGFAGLLYFVYGFAAGRSAGDNPFMYWLIEVLKLVFAVSCFNAGISYLRRKN